MPKDSGAPYWLLLFTTIAIVVVTLVIVAAAGVFLSPAKDLNSSTSLQPARVSQPQKTFAGMASSATTPTIASPQSSPLTGDFTACSGIDSSEKETVAYHRILLASSNDGLHFTKLNQVISDRASVPDIITDSAGHVRLYFIQVACREQNMRNDPVVAVSTDSGKSWIYKKLTIEAPAEAAKCKEPGGNPPPVDPAIVVLPDASYRLYSTCPKGEGRNQTPMTFVFTSTDGFNFKNGRPTYVPQNKMALDPTVIEIGSTWHLFNGGAPDSGNHHAISTDGLTFTETSAFCPLSLEDNKTGKNRCFPIGDPLSGEAGKYRLYLFGSSPGVGFKSVTTADGVNWTVEQKTGEYLLTVDNNSQTEYYEIDTPTVTKLKDGTYLMAYESFIPGTPNNIITGTVQQMMPSGGGTIPPPH